MINYLIRKIQPGVKFVVKQITSLLLLLLLAPLPLLAFQQPLPGQQINKDTTVKPPAKPDYFASRKKFGRSALLLGVAELTPWTFDRFIGGAYDYKVDFGTIKHNINLRNWAFDNDPFVTNQFAHPFHGSTYFNAFRANGYTFWQSVPAPFVGSYIWETLSERQSPAPNDFINTSFGGVILGEMTFRLSTRIVNNQSRGFKRQAAEAVALLIDPMNGLNRIINGKWGKVTPNSSEHDSSKVYGEIDIGMRRINGYNKAGNLGWYGHAKLLYGTPDENYRVPFSNIAINAEFGKDDSTAVNVVSAYGSLAGWEVTSTDKVEQVAVLSANYDYIHNQQFFYGGQSIKINLYSEYDLAKKIKINTVISAGPIILGAAPDIYRYHGRDYDYGSGASASVSAGIKFDDRLSYTIHYGTGWLGSLNGYASHYFIHTVSSEISAKIIDGFSLAGEPGYFSLSSYYKNHPELHKNYPYLRLSARYSVNF